MKNGPGALNRVYRLVWNERTGAWVAVAETTRGRGKRSSGVMGAVGGALVAAGLLAGGGAWAADPPAAGALPQGGRVVAGQAGLASSGNRLDITQGSAKAAIDWQSFDIGSAAQVHIQQPGASSVLLNRVTGPDPSSIYGRLSANGQVLLVNPNGIVFGKGSQVDVGGIVASTLDIANADFDAGRYSFRRKGATGSVLNQGRITAAAGGYVALLAPEVVNEGVVAAHLGTVALAAGDAITLDVNGSELLGVKVDPATVAAMVDNRQLVLADGGRVILSAGAAQRLREQAVAGGTGANALVEQGGVVRLVSAGGRIEAGSGRVAIEGSSVELGGSVSASGRIDVAADTIGQGGTLDASATAGAGGQITLNAGLVLQTAQAQLRADGASGGSIRIDAGSRLYSSATYSATGSSGRGGEIAATATSVQLRAATLDASGATGGGRIRVGGGFQGGDADIANARELGVNGTTVLRADATGSTGDGGQVVLWSDDRTVFGGRLSARGGAAGGNGGRAEVSGKGDLTFNGSADLAAPAGQAGRLLLDPRNLIVDVAGNSIAALNLDDPTPSASNGFGTQVQLLTNGNTVITAPNADTGANTGTGAVYLFDTRTGALLANLRGSQAGDHVGGAGVQVLANQNYLVLSPQYGTVSGVNVFGLSTADSNAVPGASAYPIQQATTASAGAITWQSATGSGSAAVGSGNSLVGSTANTESVTRYTYSGNTINNAGSITITANDQLGKLTTYDIYGSVLVQGTTTITELAGGNVAIAAPNWFDGRGAVAWMNGSTGALANAAAGGAVSSSTALVGSTGIRSQALVSTDSAKKVYVIGVDSVLPYTYTQGATNRRTAPPGGAGDSVGQSITALPGGGYAISSPLWSNGGSAYAGAVSYGAAGGSVGTVSASNSLVGSHAYDFIGSGGVSVVGSANYVVASPYWSDGGNAASGRYLLNNPNGAVTWVDGSNGNVFGAGSAGATVSTTNSLYGSAGSMLGSRDTYTNSPYTSYDYNSSYVLTTTSSTRLQVSGTGGVTLLKNGNYLVLANAWNGTRGSVTFGNGASGVAGAVSSSNSLVGAAAGDAYGNSVVELSGSNFLVVAPYSDLGAVDGGAVTWGSGTAGIAGTVGTGNSLYGNQAGARVGSGGVLPVGTRDVQGLRPNAIVLSPQWGNRSASTSTVAYGAVTWLDGSTGYAYGQGATGAAVSSGNSLVGSSAGDYVGSIHTADARASSYLGDGSSLYQVTGAWDAVLSGSVDVLANGDYLVRSPNWGGGKGAVTWGAGASGLAGAVSSSNSLVGSTADVISTSTATQTRAGMSFTDTTYRLTTTGDHVGLLGQVMANGNYLAISPYWNGGRGAITWIGSGNRTGTVSSSNSLVGSTPDSWSDANHSAITATGDRLGTMPSTNWSVPVISDATVSGQTYTTSTARPTGPYSFGTSYAIVTASWYAGGGNVTLGRSYYNANTPQNLVLDNSWGYLTTNFTYNGTPIVQQLANGNVLVASPGWNNGAATRAGAVSWIDGSTGALAGGGAGGALSASNSLVGSHADDVLGFRLPVDGFAQLSNGNFLLVNPQWNDERGAVTWGSGTAGVTGTVSSGNSLVGSTASGSLGFVTASDYVYRIVDAKATLNGDWIDRRSDLTGDRVGIGGVTVLADGNAVVGSPLWSQTGAWSQTAQPNSLGAATWINGSNGQLIDGAAGGAVSSANSLVGSQAGDAVGYNAWVDPNSGTHYLAPGITALSGGRYVVASPWWNRGGVAEAGAVSFAAAGGIAGAVSESNSLVGSTAGDHVGRSLSEIDLYTYGAKLDAGVVVLDNGSTKNYLVRSTDWTNGFATSGAAAGAVTWVDGSNGHATGESGTGAAVGVRNSLTGNTAGDGVGSQIVALTRNVSGTPTPSGDLLVLSNVDLCGNAGFGAITLVSASQGAAGPISWRNSVLGLAAASDGLQTTAFDGYSYNSDIRATLLPTAVTAAEQVAYRPLVWVAPNASSGNNASRAMVLTLVADNAAAPTSADQINGTAGNANWGGSLFVGNGSGFSAVGGTSGLLAFSASSGSDAVITPAAITAMLNAGTAVTLQASNDITVLRDIVASAGGSGGNLTLEAGRSIYLRANIDTDGGHFAAHANQSSAGVVDADCSACTAVITQQAGTTVRTGAGNAAFVIDESTSKTYNDAGTLRLASVDATQVLASNAGVNAGGTGQGLRFQPGATLGNGATEYLTLQARGTSATGGGIVLAADTQLAAAPWATMFVGPSLSNIATTFGGSTSTGLAMTAAEMGTVIRQSTGFGGIIFGANSSAPTTIGSIDFTQTALQRPGSSLLSLQLGIQGGSGGLNVAGALKSGSAGDYGIELTTWNGTLSLGSSSSITASTGILSFVTHGGGTAVTQAAGSTLDVSRLGLGGEGSVNLVNGTNTIGVLGGAVDSAQVKTAGTLTVGQIGGSLGLTVTGGAVLQASGASADLVLDQPLATTSGSLVLAAGRNFVNHNTADTGLVTGTGRYLVYSASPSASTEAMSGYGKHYAQSYSAGSTPGYAASGNWFLYSVAPTLSVSAGSGSTVTYGASASAPSVGISGFIDGDTVASATTGSLASSLSSYTPSGAGYVPVGSYTLTLTGQGSFASSLGYAISVTPGSSTLTVQAKAINVSGLSANNKVYDGTTSTSVSGSAGLQGGGSNGSDGKLMSGDTVSVSGTATGAFADRNAGTGKSVTLSGLALSGADAGNYTISAGSVTADITPKALTATGLSVAASRAYDGGTGATVIGTAALRSAEAAGTGTTSDGKPYSLDTVSITGAATATYDAATVAGASSVAFGGLTLTGAQAGNYTLSLGAQAATITPRTLTVTGVTAQNKVYDAGTTASFSGTAALSGVVGSDAVSLAGTLAGSFADANAANGKTVGTSGLSLTGGDAGNYSLGAFSPTANITARGLTLTAADQSKTYGGTDPTLTYTIGGLGLAGSDSAASVFGGALATATGAAATAGTHAISQGTLAVASSNYTLSGFTAGTLTVGKATLNVTADDKAKTYGGSDPALSYTVNASQLKYTDTASVVSGLSLSTTTGAAATAGTHAITATGGSASNYDLVLADGTLTVGKATLNVTADDKAKTYGGSDPALTYTVNASQLKYTDTASVVSGVNLSTATGASATAGTHAISATGGTASNYTLVLADGTLTVGKATLNVSADDKAKTYGGSDPALTYTVNASQLKYTDTASVVSGVSLSTATGASATAGTHAITATGGTASNYTLVLADGTLTVGKAALNVTADDKAKTYGGSDPALSYTVNASQLKYTDTAGVVSGVNLSTATGAAATAGTHTISATGGTASNYTLVLADGTLAVGKAALNVTADDKAKTYGGSDPALSYTVNASQLKYTDTASVVSGVSLATATGAAATAGTHAITATGGSASNYDLVLADGTLTVGKATLNVSADNKAKTYGDADPALSYTVNASQLKYTDTASVVSGVSLSTATGAAATAGTHAITATGGTASNYALVLADGTLTVGKATLNVSADDKAKTYGGTDPALSYTVNASQLKYTDTAGVVSGINLATATGAAATAGTHTISATGGTASNYTLVLADGTLTVGKATLNVSADDKAKSYGGSDPALTYTVNASQLKYTDTAGVLSGVSLATATGAAATAGTHAITATGGTASNYALVLADGTLTVGKATLNVTADNKAKTYGDADPSLSYTVNASQLKYTDTASVVNGVNLSTATGAAATAGTHTISATGGTASNYALVLADGTLSVGKATLNVTVDNQAKTYGDADPTLSYTVNASQLKYTDTASVVSGINLATATGAAATAGTHAITATGGTASNYALVLAGGTLTVGKAALNVMADNQAKTYGDADPALSYTVNAAQLKYADTAGVVSGITLSTATGAAATAGTHPIAIGGGTASNYALVLADGTLSVGKATLNVTADNKAKTYGDADPALSYTVNASQLKYTDTAGVVSGVNLATATGAAATAGTHTISATGGTASNYALVLADGTLSVGRAALNVSADNQAKTYGDADPALSYTVNAAQLKYADTAAVVSGVNLATATGAAATAGTHAITASGGTASNYALVLADGTLSVAKAALNVTADNQAKTWGDADPALSYTVNAAQLKYADTAAVVSGIVLSAPAGAEATAGTHVIAASGGTAANYRVQPVDGTLTVAKALLNVSADDKAKTYGDADPALSYTVNASQLKYTDTVGVVSGVNLATATGAAATAGTHAITATGGSASNYALVLSDGTLGVAKAALGVTADNKGKTYGDADPALSYTVNAAQLKYADTADVVSGIALATATGAAATAGTHAIAISGGTAENYTLTRTEGMLTVARAALTVTADDKSKTAGERDPALSYTVDAAQLKYADTAAVVSGVQLSAPQGPGVPPGDYAIVAAGGSADNYALSYVDGRYTVKPSPSVKAENLSQQLAPVSTPAASGPPVPPAAGAPAPVAGQPGSVVVIGGGVAAPAPAPSTAPAPATTPATTPAPATVPATTAAPASVPRLLSIQPETRVMAEPAREFRFDASASFERPPQAKVSYAARQADGRPLPAWLVLDSASGVLAGTPPDAGTPELEIVVTAQQEGGPSATTRLRLRLAR